MITGGRAVIAAACATVPAVEVRTYGDPAVNVPTVFVTLDSAEADPTLCAHVTIIDVLLVVQHDDPSLADALLETTADDLLDAIAPTGARFVSLQRGTFKDRAPSMLISFATRQ